MQRKKIDVVLDLGDFGEWDGFVTATVEEDEKTFRVVRIDKIEVLNYATGGWDDVTHMIVTPGIEARIEKLFEKEYKEKWGAA